LRNLARLYKEGKEVEKQDAKKAASFYRRAADAFMNQEGYEPDEVEATRLRKLADELDRK